MDTTRLPLELERKIFELAALLHPETIPDLLCVAHRVLTWLEPILYNVLRMDRSARARPIFDAIQCKPRKFLRDAVRHVLLFTSSETWTVENLGMFFDFCPGIRNLSLIGNLTGAHLLLPLENMRLQRLGICLEELFAVDANDVYESPQVDFEHPLFETVTHLDIFDDVQNDEEEDKEWLEQLPVLPALTHLAFNGPPSLSTIRHILSESPRLCVLLVTYPKLQAQGAREFADSIDVEDPRLVVAVNEVNYYDDWEAGARGREDIWFRADAFVAAKSRGLIRRMCPYALEQIIINADIQHPVTCWTTLRHWLTMIRTWKTSNVAKQQSKTLRVSHQCPQSPGSRAKLMIPESANSPNQQGCSGVLRSKTSSGFK
ncbi:hypothetical protein C8J57DRAFT_1498144 [Mycena rebaudengoi]|nr:hypothetical protein C8J57DRAFT_1498144 [Mycena rebaudengoi]